MTTRMGIIAYAAGAALLAAAAWFGFTHRPDELVSNELGTVRHFAAWPAWRREAGFVYVLSGSSGWRDADERTAEHFARAGAEVIGIDAAHYLQHLASAGTGCAYLPGPLEAFSRARQRHDGDERYSRPILLGRAEGATLAYVAMLQSPPLAFDAAVAVDPVPGLPIHRDFCGVATDRDPGGTVRLHALTPSPRVSLAVLATPQASPVARLFAAAIRRDNAGSPPMADSDLSATYRAALAGLSAGRLDNGVADLPLVEVPAASATGGDTLAVLYSGDGGWRDLDRSLANVLAAKGMPVVGMDVLSYFWRRRSPDTAAADLARTIEYYCRSWHRDRVVMIGFSFGGNVLPFLIDRLPEATRARIVLTSLLSPERTATFEINPGAWMGFTGSRGRVPIVPALARIASGKVQCYYGEEEQDASLCSDHLPPQIEVIRKRGGHHFDKNYDELADEILASVPGAATAVTQTGFHPTTR